MGKTISLDLPEGTLERYRHGAAAAGKALEVFLVDRLEEAAPPATEDLPSPIREELAALETLDSDALCEVARTELPEDRQCLYDDLMEKSGQGTATLEETEKLRALGEEARRLTLRRSHAYLLLKWRGHPLPSRSELLSAE